jgi:predicted DNA-binding transcriptional regulator AlpA
MSEPIRLLRRAVVKDRTSLSNTHLHELIKAGQFPAPTYITTSKRLPVWDERVVNAWIESRLSGSPVAHGSAK